MSEAVTGVGVGASTESSSVVVRTALTTDYATTATKIYPSCEKFFAIAVRRT